MKAGVFYGKEDLRIEERPVPRVGPGQMLVKIAYVGICGTDVELYKTGMTPPPLQDAPGAGPRELRRGMSGGRRSHQVQGGRPGALRPPRSSRTSTITASTAPMPTTARTSECQNFPTDLCYTVGKKKKRELVLRTSSRFLIYSRLVEGVSRATLYPGILRKIL